MNDDQSDEPPADPLPAYVRGLLDPGAYPDPPDRIELVQTHISYVFLAGDVVYKTKKPVDFGFIDQVAPERREAFCHAEVELNRRLAPDVYLDTVPVVRRGDGRYAVDVDPGEGEVVEWAVKMRRLPDGWTLAALLGRHAEPHDLMEHIVERLVAFHDAAPRVAPDRLDYAGGEGVRRWWEREYAEAEGFIGDTWRSDDAANTRSFIERTIEAQQALFDRRLAEGRVVEGHGDLHAKHVYVLGRRPEDLAIVDCIEFTDWFQFRYLDVGYDVAFLAMDLEARGRPELADEFAGRYIAASADETLGVLQPLHRAFRAFVRGKVESIGARAPEVSLEQRRELGESAARYFHLAAEYAHRSAAPCLVVMAGLSGTGKTAVGATLAARVGAALVSSDIVREELAGGHPKMWQRFEEGAYSPEMNRKTYDEMRERATNHIRAGRPVVLDASHRRVADRQAAVALGRELGVPTLLVELRLTDDAALARVAGREARVGTEVNAEAFRHQLDAFEPISAIEADLLQLDASQSLSDLAREIAESLPGR